MSSNSEAVKRWRKKTRKRIIESLGGKCACCGYNKCYEAIEIHHINSNTKKFSISRIWTDSLSWEKIAEEIRKCVLICSNCNKEINIGISSLPPVLPKFSERNSYVKN
jgi:hypothetical protein